MAPTLVRIRADVTLARSIGSRWPQTIFVKYSSIEIGHIFSAVLMNLTGFDKMPIFESFWFSSALKEIFYLIINFTINEMESFTNSTLSGKS